MKKSKQGRFKVLLLGCMLFPCAAMAQGTLPLWLDADVRNAQYPADTYYTGFTEVSVAAGEGQEKALARAKQRAIGELSERVRVMVSTEKKSTDVSIAGNDMEEQIRSKFESAVQTASQAAIVGSTVKTHYDAARKTGYAFACVSKTELIKYYRNQISLQLGKAEGGLRTATQLENTGAKAQARKECENLIPLLAKAAYAQDLLTAVDADTDESGLQQTKSETLRNEMVQMLMRLAQNILVYVESKEDMLGQKVNIAGGKLSELLTRSQCNCSVADNADDADYTLLIDAAVTECKDAGNGVYCYAKAKIVLRNNRTKSILQQTETRPEKGGHITSQDKAARKAFEKVAEDIVNVVITEIKKLTN